MREKFPFEFSVSATTRPARTGEENGVDYFFVDEAEFDLMVEAGDFLEWAFYNDRRYGTLRSQVIDTLEAGNDVVLDIEVQGAAQVRERHPGALMIFIGASKPRDPRRKGCAPGVTRIPRRWRDVWPLPNERWPQLRGFSTTRS